MNIHADFIYKTGSQKRICQLATTHQADSLSRLSLQVPHEFDRIVCYQLDARPVDGFQSAREDVSAHGWILSRAALLPGWSLSGRVRLRGRDRIGLPTHQ